MEQKLKVALRKTEAMVLKGPSNKGGVKFWIRKTWVTPDKKKLGVPTWKLYWMCKILYSGSTGRSGIWYKAIEK